MSGATTARESGKANGNDDQTHEASDSELDPIAISDLESEDEGSEETTEHAHSRAASKRILREYRHLLSRRVDLVGDYAGDELFLIDGDSMLLRCFDDEKLDFSPGCQLLHATYNVEHFLHHLVQRKCHFNIVFFDSNRSLCLPPSADQSQASKYFLARAAIIRHLQANLAKSHPHICIKLFRSWESPAFLEYLQRASPYFLMAHDGASPVDRSSKFTTRDTERSEPSEQRIILRKMILSFIRQGFNVALVNGLEWRDTKVMTIILEKPRQLNYEKIFADAANSTAAAIIPKIDVSTEITGLGGSGSELSDRQILLVVTVSRILAETASDQNTQELAQKCAALLLHQAILAHLPVSGRRLGPSDASQSSAKFLLLVSSIAESLLNDDSWQATNQNDASDFIDGRLFLSICQKTPAVSSEVKATFEKLLHAVGKVSEAADRVAQQVSEKKAHQPEQASNASSRQITVLPFSNKVFDKHLEPVGIKVGAAAEGERSLAARKIFQEVSHWHNAKRPIIQKGPQTPADAKQAFWAAKRNQLFMAEMRTYAASLTNALGKSLEPEAIIVGSAPRPAKPVKAAESPADSEASDSGASSQSKGKPGQKKGGGGGKTAAKNAGKQAMLNQIAAAKAKKDESTGDKIAASWQTVCKNLEANKDPRMRYRKAKDYLTNLPSSSKEVVGAEVELYMLSQLLLYWQEVCRQNQQAQRLQVTALAWSHARSIASQPSLSKTIIKSVDLTVKTLGLPSVPLPTESANDRKLAFTFALPTKVDNLEIKLPSKEFQLLECGPYLERTFDSKPDPRVDFQPDGWQRKVLDTIDNNQSSFVVAPTSAGKTFISFYAMRKVLEADDDGVIVYVAPTKALVNQIAAEVIARYSKNFKYGGKSVWAIHTRDYRINNPTGCQVLVTVPHVLQIMLLAPSNANSWSSRVKRIIFDEIHSIGQAEDGVVWEQLLLMAPCPIIALSATVGNPDEFADWLGTTQKAIGKETVTVQHPYRYSDLRKYYYVTPKTFSFNGIPEKSAFGSLGLEGLSGFNFVHPVAALVDRSRGMPEDLALEPRDCYILWQTMTKLQDGKHPVPKELSPEKALPDVSRKVDILKWERALKELLKQWIDDTTSPYESLVHELGRTFRDEKREDSYLTVPDADAAAPKIVDADSLRHTTLPMLCRLNEQDALPAILFNFDRHACEKICKVLVEQLAQAEEKQQKSGNKWQKTLQKWEEWKEQKQKAASRTAKATSKSKKSKGDDADDDDKASKLDLQRDAAGGEDTKWESFDPDAPLSGYHFADESKVQRSELDTYIRQLRRREVQPWLIESLGRGIGVHHAGMNRKYRQVVEILFRKGFLRIIIATGTLALGINMPTRTVVFSGDSVFLTALNYRQCAGRAGRRGFDLLGNVVFQGIPHQKVCRLISSRLPDLNGHFPITTTLVLRLFTLLHESNNSKYAVSAINALLSQPRLYMGGPSFKDQTMHHLRFSIEYLRRQQLLGSDGAPLNFAGLVSHLYFTENSSFAFHALLKEGYFHQLCAKINENEKDTLETLMLTMSHLFNRVLCRQADAEYREKVVKPSSSIVFLPPLPAQASQILLDHNQQTLKVFRSYVETFAQQHIQEADRTLPLSRMKVGAETNAIPTDIETLPPARIRSSFVALSGAGDEFDSIHDLCQTTRDGVFLEEAVIPHMEVYPEEMEVPLNAYLLDFFKHGDVMTIERANGIRRSDIWFFLNDFSLVLATIITSLLNFMKLADGTDMDMLDIMGRMDAHEEEEDDKIAAVEQQSEVSGPSVADSAIVMADQTKPSSRAAPPTKKQSKNADSWEDLAGDDDEDDAEGMDSTAQRELGLQASDLAQELSAWDGEGGEGLKHVLKAFQKLHAEFNIKFRAMWA